MKKIYKTITKQSLIKILAITPILILCLTWCKDSSLNLRSVDSSYEFGTLSQLAGEKTDKGIHFHYFTEIYEHIFFPLKDTPIKIFEIGIYMGSSLNLWQDYFPYATVYGIDIVDKSELNTEKIKTFVADQANRKQLQSFVDKYGSDFDIILDDGGHTMEQQQISLGYLFKHVKGGGYYIIEDVHTSLPEYYPGYGVEENKNNSTLRMINNFIKNARIESKYLTLEEENYLNTNIEYCNLFFRNNDHHSITCIMKKHGIN